MGTEVFYIDEEDLGSTATKADAETIIRILKTEFKWNVQYGSRSSTHASDERKESFEFNYSSIP